MTKEKENPGFMEDIYRKHERLMYYIAGKYTTNLVQREDIVQTAVLAILKNEATLQRLPPYAQVNYIAVAVRNTAVNAIKRNQTEAARHVPFDDISEDCCHAHISGAEVIYLEKERQEELLAIFREMREEEQQLLMGKYLMDLSDAELAQTLGCKASSIRMKLTRARRTFIKNFKMEVMTMHEQEKLYEQYEDAVFALLMDKVAEENGKKLLQQNEELLADPYAAVPETLRKRCLRTIEKAYRKTRWKAATKKSDTGAQSRCFMDSGSALLFGTAFAASETVRVKTLNFLITNFEFGTEFRIENTASATPQQQSMTPIVDDCIPFDYDLISQSSTSLFEKYLYANDSDSELSIIIYALENFGGAITIDTEDAEVWYNTIDDQSVMYVQKADTYQAVWTDVENQKMYVLSSSNTALDVVYGIVEKMLSSIHIKPKENQT